jgi:hypothetical protein
VLDTNVLVSGLGWSGPPAAIVEAVTAGELTFLSSPALITELRRVLNYPKLAKVFADPNAISDLSLVGADAFRGRVGHGAGGCRWQVVGGRLSGVKKTSIYVEPDVDLALARRAAAEGTTKAQLIREALREAAGESLRRKPRARGVFTGPADLASHSDEHLARSGFGEP